MAAALNESSEPWLINYISKSHDGPDKIIFILLVVGSWSVKACLYQTFLKHFDKFIIQYRGCILQKFLFIYLLASRVYVDNGISCSLYQKIVEDLRRPVSRCLFLEKGKKKEKRKKRVFLGAIRKSVLNKWICGSSPIYSKRQLWFWNKKSIVVT